MLRENTDMERQMTKLRNDFEISKKELSERTLQLSQLRKRKYYIIGFLFTHNMIFFIRTKLFILGR